MLSDSGLAGLSVIVAGGGIGGLASALALARRGARVTVIERRPEPGEEGAGIQIGPNGTRILQDLGVAPYLEPLVATPQALLVHDGRSGNRLARMPLGDWLANRHGAPYWVAHRADLHRALIEASAAYDGIARSYGLAIDGLRADADGIEVSAAGRPLGRADLLIAADGLHSRLRGLVVPQACPPRFAGRTAARAVLPADAVPDAISRTEVGIWLAPFGHVVHYPVRCGREVAIVVIRKSATQSDGWATPVPAAEIAEAVARFAVPVRDLVAAASGWKRWSLATMPALPTWVGVRAALLGDAAHPVLPFLASGAVLALEDAATLAAELARGRSLQAGLAAYQARRQPRAARVQVGSRRNGDIYHASGPIALARNAALRLTPPEQLMASYDWLYGWRAEG